MRTATIMALQAQAVIVGWQIYSLTRDPFMLGLVGLAEAIPAITAAFFAGHIVDTSRPQKVYILAGICLVLNTLGLFLVGGGIVSLDHNILVAFIFLGVFLSGLARSFMPPATFAMLPHIIPRADLPAASSWITSGFQIGAIAGPAIAGVLYGFYGPLVAWMMPLGLLIIALMAALGMKVNIPAHVSEGKEPMFKSIRAGWLFVIQNPVLLSVMALDMFAVLFGGAVAMLPAFADQILQAGSEGLGAMRAAPAVGAVIVALYFGFFPMKVVSARVLLCMVAGFGASIIGFGLSTSFWVSMAFLAASGAFDSVSMIMRSTILQLMTPDRMRGRVSSLSSIFVISSNEIGAFESGLAARILGLVPSIVFGGGMTLMIVGMTSFISPKFRNTIVKADDRPLA